MSDNNITILDGSTFLVSSPNGDIEAMPDQPQGLFYKDMRHLSKWKLTIQGKSLDVLSTDVFPYYYAQHFCVPPTGTIHKNPIISIIRRRLIGDGFVEDLTVFNHGTEAKEVELRLDGGADFADLFEVKDALEKKGRLYREIRDVDVVLDSVGGETQERSWGVLRRGGILINIVSPVAAEKAASLGLRATFFIVEPNRAQLIQLGHLIDKGTLRVVIRVVLPLASAREAFEQGSAGHKPGKTVLQVAAAESAKA